MKRGSFAAGFLTCLLLMGVTTTAFAAGIMAERSNHPHFCRRAGGPDGSLCH